jgi:hypothetical protein
MKKVLIFVWLAACAATTPAQELDSLKAIMDNRNTQENQDNPESKSYSPVTIEENNEEVKIKLGDKELLKVIDSSDSTYVRLGDSKILEVFEDPDSTRIRVGDKEISIIEKDNNTKIHLGDVDEGRKGGHGKFRGHWAGFEWGINNFLDQDFTLSREDEDAYMDLITDRSWCINLNFAQYSLGFNSSQVGMLIGMGLAFSNYYFDNDNTIAEVDDYVVPVYLDGTSLTKSKLVTTFIRIPLIVEVQFPRSSSRSHRIFVSAGLLTGIKLDSHTKVVFEDDNGKNKDKDNDDFNINPFRYGLTARIGFHNVSLFGDYNFTPMFTQEKGPELYPFSLGLSLTF